MSEVEAQLSFPGRIFQIWRYSIGHSELLLRSHHRKHEEQRIDILFKAVDAVHLPRFGLQTSLIIQRLRDAQSEIFPGNSFSDGYLYQLRSEEVVGYVHAMSVFARADDGDHTGLGPFYDTPLSGTELGSL